MSHTHPTSETQHTPASVTTNEVNIVVHSSCSCRKRLRFSELGKAAPLKTSTDPEFDIRRKHRAARRHAEPDKDGTRHSEQPNHSNSGFLLKLRR